MNGGNDRGRFHKVGTRSDDVENLHAFKQADRCSSLSPGTPRQAEQVGPIVALVERLAQGKQLPVVNPPQMEGNLLWTGDFKPLSLFDCLDEVRGLQERFRGPGIHPGKTPAQTFDVQLVFFQVILGYHTRKMLTLSWCFARA